MTRLLSLTVVLVILTHTVLIAQPMVFTETYTYQASEIDSKVSSRIIALQEVKRILLEKIGVYIESQTEVENFVITRDQITAFTAGIVQCEIIDEEWTGKTYTLTAKLTADPKEVAENVSKLQKDRQKTAELLVIREELEKSRQEIASLREQLSGTSEDQKQRYNEAVKVMNVTQLLQEGNMHVFNNRFDAAIEAFERCLVLDPNNHRAYYGLGYVYTELSQSRIDDMIEALEYFRRALEIEPVYLAARNSLVGGLLNVGTMYANSGNYAQAVNLFSEALAEGDGASDRVLSITYANRATALTRLNKLTEALEDCNKAIELTPEYAKGYMQKVRVISELDTNWNKRADVLRYLNIAAVLGDPEAQKFLDLNNINWRDMQNLILAALTGNQEAHIFLTQQQIPVTRIADLVRLAVMNNDDYAQNFLEGIEIPWEKFSID
ncbi:hypothetical protein CHISP_3672 [Chitinispirillum alkaliphilum]|nr:hypothetical protein CHISP_3672 [Chitinispirillum alkaliphilum]